MELKKQGNIDGLVLCMMLCNKMAFKVSIPTFPKAQLFFFLVCCKSYHMCVFINSVMSILFDSLGWLWSSSVHGMLSKNTGGFHFLAQGNQTRVSSIGRRFFTTVLGKPSKLSYPQLKKQQFKNQFSQFLQLPFFCVWKAFGEMPV